jgi:hypothetical protein
VFITIGPYQFGRNNHRERKSSRRKKSIEPGHLTEAARATQMNAGPSMVGVLLLTCLIRRI